MTEAEWFACQEPGPMCAHVGDRKRTYNRQLRLLACAYARRIWKHLVGVDRVALEVAEQYAEGLATEAELETAKQEAKWALEANGEWAHPADTARWTAGQSLLKVRKPQRAALVAKQVALMHDVIGNPFRPVVVDPAWLTPSVVQIAQAAYDERVLPLGELELDRLAVLADALQDAGCEQRELLEHLVSPGPHIRGCWVVDLVIGKGSPVVR